MLVGLLHDVISFTYCCDISTSAGLCKYKTSTAEKPKLYEGERGGLPQTHCSWSFHHASSLIQSGLHLWYILHMGTSRLVHNNCILLLLQPSFQQLLVSTLNQCFKETQPKYFMSLESIESHTTSAYLGICWRLPRSPTAAHDTVVRIKATFWGGVQKKMCIRANQRVWDTANASLRGRLWTGRDGPIMLRPDG